MKGDPNSMSDFLNDFKNYIKQNGENIYSIAEFCMGGEAKMLEIQESNPCNNIYSVSKVFTVTAIGMLTDRGLLKTSETVSEILKDEMPKGYNRFWDETTVDMLLRHRIGIAKGALDIDCLDASKFDPDYLKEVTALPWDCPPDTEKRYTDGAFYIASRIVAARAKKPLQVFLWEDLFLPLKYKEAAWSSCPMGHAMGATGLYIRCGDMVKLGGVYLQKGMWENKRILSEKWVDTVFERGYELSKIKDSDAYKKSGMRGQNLIIIPSKKKAVGWIGHTRSSKSDLVRFVLEHN